MTFEEEMDRFFKAYPPEKRATVEMSEEYQAAAKDKDVVKAQEIAAAMLHGHTTVRLDPIVSILGFGTQGRKTKTSRMKVKRITFGNWTEITNPADLPRSFLFRFSCVDTDLVGSPEEARFTSQHRLMVTVDHHLFLAWEFSDPDLVKVLYEIGRRDVVGKVKDATLGPTVRVQL